jgi:8-oxo-dGTP diphosphatase
MDRTGDADSPGRRPPGQITLIVDGANVMGSRANGWWRDRAGAMARLHAELVALAGRGIAGPPPGDAGDAGEAGDGQAAGGTWFPRIVLVAEGRARAAAGLVSPGPGVELVAAAGEGDDEIARLAGSVPGRRIVITADQELRRRARLAGAEVAGPRWLTGLLA